MKNKNKIIGVLPKCNRLILLLGFLCIFSTGFPKTLDTYEQTKKIAISLTNKPISEILKYIEKNSEYLFLYSENVLDDSQRKTIHLDNKLISDVLDQLFAGMPIGYTINNRQISLKQTLKPVQPTISNQEKKRKIVTGIIKDISGETAIGVTVIEKGNVLNGVATDIDGKFSFNVADDAIIIVSYIGFKTKEINTAGKSTLNIIIEEDTQALGEVVIVGYGTSTKATITGALSSVGTEELLRSPAVNITQALAGALPGISTVQTSGQPGRDAATIYIRGNGTLSNGGAQPLVLVDGVERSLSDLDPNEIETLSILKDASSTAVFGVRGANGVILVTTRRGFVGEPQISVSSNFGLQQPMSLVQAANSYEYAKMWNIRSGNDGSSALFTHEQIEAFRTNSDPLIYPSVDWADYMFNDFNVQSKNSVNISGGSDKVKYFVNFGYTFQNGILKQFDALDYNNNYSYNKYNYRANLDIALSETTAMQFNIGGNLGQIKEPIAVEDVGYVWNVATVWSVPFAGPGIVDGLRTLAPSSLYPTGDVLRDGLFAFYGYGYKQQYETKLNLDVDITQKLDKFLPGLNVGVKGSYNSNLTLGKRRQSSIYSNHQESQIIYYKSMLTDPSLPQTDPSFDKTLVFVPDGEERPLGYSENKEFGRNWYVEARLNYDNTFNFDHKVTALVLYNQSRNYYPESWWWMPKGYIGLVGRATYGYKHKYLLDFNVGYNGSENFAPGKNRFGVFPSISGAWIASEESFMDEDGIVDYLKFRASWGRVGSDVGNKQRFMYMANVWDDNNGSYNFGVDNPVSLPGATMNTSGNPDVTWETADKQNYGIDAYFLDNRLTLNVDYFIEKRTGILITPKSVPSIIATSLPNMNLGKVNNRGYEIVLGWEDNISSDFRYNVNFNVSHAKNKIIYMDEVRNEFDYKNRTGGSTDLYGGLYQFDRFYQYEDFDTDAQGNYVLKESFDKPYIAVQPGDAKYVDISGDGIIDADDQMVSGYSTRPEYVYGFLGGFDYKGISFSMQWTGASHVNKLMDLDYRIPFTNADRGLLDFFIEESWTPENQQDATMPRLSKNMEAWNQAPSTLWLKDASYLRLKTVNLAYTFRNKKSLSSVGIKSLTLTLSGYNLLTFSKLKIMDPETISDNAGQYPITKVYNLGVGINF